MANVARTSVAAVDANVLIFERIREELRNGNSPQASIRAGYEKAFSTIADANITTLIAAIVLRITSYNVCYTKLLRRVSVPRASEEKTASETASGVTGFPQKFRMEARAAGPHWWAVCW